MNECVFCKVKNGDFNTKFVYEDEDIMVFPDLHPKAPIHLLFVPKNHIEELLTVEDSSVYAKIFTSIQKVAKEHGLSEKGFRVIVNAGGAQEVNHLHIHLMGPVGTSSKL